MIKDAEEFIMICQSDDPNVYTRFNNDLLTDEVGFSIIATYPQMANNVADNKTISLNLIKYLSNHENWRVRWSIAQKLNLTYELFDKLSQDKEEGIRHRIVMNPNTPIEILERLTHDVWGVCAEDTQEKLQERLAKEI